MRRGFRWLATLTAVSAYFQISLGGVVRVSGSGLGCGDQWPPCHGSLLPPLEVHAIIEYAHRVFGAATSFLMLATALAAWLVFRRSRPLVPWLATAALAVVALEIPLGALVVFRELAGVLVLLHLAVAMTILGLLVATAVLSGPEQEPLTGVPAQGRLWLATGLTFLVLLTGTGVVASGADELCHAWPLCGNGLVPDFGGVNAFTMVHRLTTAVAGVIIALVLFDLLRRRAVAPGVKPAAVLTLVALLVQVALGAGAALGGSSPLFDGLHVSGAGAVWAGMVATATFNLPRPLAERRERGRLQLEGKPA